VDAGMQITNELANRIYDVLVKACETDEASRQRFIYYITNPAQSHEWRFIGSLGFGGKLYHNHGRIYVGCYWEDETEERRMTIDRANQELSKIVGGVAVRHGS
jgi:hypothetical protein